jgi:serpin B
VKRLIGRRTALALLGLPAALSLGSTLTGCSAEDNEPQDDTPASLAATDLTASVETASSSQESPGDILLDETTTLATFGFAASLFKGVYAATPQDNVLVSPLSALFALALAETGAAGETLSQLETATGMDIATLMSYLGAYTQYLSGEPLYGTGEKGNPLPLKSANSIWLRASEDLTVSDDYLSTCKNAFSAQTFSAPFDSSTVENINSWVSQKTDGMIDQLVEQINDDAQLFLINALAFDDAWQEPFDDSDVEDDTFTAESGDEQTVRMMHSHETTYLENELVEGFLRPYEGYSFAFVALLPKQGAKLADYVASLDAASLHDLVANPVPSVEVDTGLPKFSLDHETTLNEQLAAMGVHDAFDATSADFSRMGTLKDGNLAISKVLQKTFIDVNETGTRAAVATSVEISGSSAAPAQPEVREVILDRPFAYAIVDNTTLTPLFVGVISSME